MTATHKTLTMNLAKGLHFFTLFVAIGLLGGCQGVEETSEPDCIKEPAAEGCQTLKVATFPAPKNLTATVLDQTSIHLTWDKPSTTKTFQTEIQMKTGAGNFVILKKIEGDVEEFDANHLSADTSYTFRIRALGDAESEFTSEVSMSTMTATINPLFPKPTLTSAVVTLGMVTLSKTWSNTSSVYVAGIEYEIMAEGNYTWSLLGSGSFASSYSHAAPAGILQYKIKVIYTDGTIYADEAGLVIAKLLPPTDVDGSEVDIFGIAKHKITWEYGTSSAAHVGYILLVEYINTSNLAASTQVILANNTVKTHTMIPACQSGTPVEYRVKAVSGNALILASDASAPEFVIDCP